MAYQVLGSVIINNSRDLIGVNTAGVDAALYVGANFEVDAASGVATAAGLAFGAGPTYTAVSTDISGAVGATELASAPAIKTYVDSQITDNDQLNFIADGNTGVIGEVGLGSENFNIAGTANQLGAVVAVGGGNTITLSLANELIAPGSIEATTSLRVGAGLTLDAGLRFGVGQEVTSIVTTVDSGSTDTQLATAQAVFEAVGGGGGDLNVNNIDAAGYVQVGAGLTANGGLDVVGHSELDSLRASGIATITGLLDANGGLDVAGHSEIDSLNVAGLATFAQAVELSSTLQFGPAGTGISTFSPATDLGGGAAADSAVPTQLAVKTYVDNQIGGANFLTFSDGTTDGRIDLGASETFDLLGGTNISASVSGVGLGNTITFNLDDNVSLAGNLTAGTGIIVSAGGAAITGVCSATDFNSTSDINKKENIEEIPAALDKVEALRGVLFDWKDGSGRSGGIIAQEVEAVLPELIRENGDHKTVIYNGLVGLLINAVKELHAEVEELKQSQVSIA